MFYKIYDKIKHFILDNYLVLLFYIVLICVFTYPLPYYIYTGGGLMDVSSKIKLSNGNKINGSYNMCYVSELEATIPTYLFSFFKNDWDLITKKEIGFDQDEKRKNVELREKIYLNSSTDSAVINAFKKANLEYEIIESNPIVIYVMQEANSDLMIGDEIISINDNIINSHDDIVKIVNDLDINTKVNIRVKNNNKEYERYAYIKVVENKKLLGIALDNKTVLKTNPEVNFKFSEYESGPSGGLILSLALYDYLTENDLAKGLKISGTGTIDNLGNVGEIGGVKYKLKGAVKKKSDIFFIPNGSNYDEAIELQKKYNYKIKIVGVSTFDEAISYLESIN